MTEHENRLTECFALLERTGDAAFCKALYPDLADDIDHFVHAQTLLGDDVPAPDDAAVIGARNRLLAAVGAAPVASSRRSFWTSSLGKPRWFAAGIAAGLLLTASIGASAAGLNSPGPSNQFLTALGLTNAATATPEATAISAVEASEDEDWPGLVDDIVACIDDYVGSDATPEPTDTTEETDGEATGACTEFETAFQEWASALPEGSTAELPSLQSIQETVDALCGLAIQYLPEGMTLCDPEAGSTPASLIGASEATALPSFDLDQSLDEVLEQVDAALEEARLFHAAACERLLAVLPEGMQVPSICDSNVEDAELSSDIDFDQIIQDLIESFSTPQAGESETAPNLDFLDGLRQGACEQFGESMAASGYLRSLCEAAGQ